MFTLVMISTRNGYLVHTSRDYTELRETANSQTREGVAWVIYTPDGVAAEWQIWNEFGPPKKFLWPLDPAPEKA